MALALSVVAVDQVDLQVAQVGALAQVVLPHQTVEIDRCGGAGVALVVANLGDLVQHAGQFHQERVGVLQGAAFGQVDDDL
ncbi:hypothetical protein D3C81_2084840 [compost metagenome]